MINFNRTLELAGQSGFVQPVKLVQYDDAYSVGVFSLTENGQPFTMPTGAAAKVRMKKPDGKGVYNDAEIDGDTVKVTFTQQMTAAFGAGFLNIELTVDGGVKCSEPLQVVVLENAVQEGQIESTDEFLTLEEILQQAQKWGQIVQQNAGNIQTVVDNLQAIKDAPTQAANAAASAAEAKAAAQESKGFRTFYSSVRPDDNGNLDPSRPMFAGSGTTVNIEAKGDRIESVTVNGYTQQAGSGDPSPVNQRPITVGGRKMVDVVFDGSSDEAWSVASWSVNASGTKGLYLYFQGPKASSSDSAVECPAYCDMMKSVNLNNLSSSTAKDFTCGVAYSTNNAKNGFYVRYKGVNDVTTLRGILQKKPLTVWYEPEDKSQATGIYVPYITEGAEYACQCAKINDYLCEGDTLESNVPSGCDKVVVFDGSADEAWGMQSGTGVQYYNVPYGRVFEQTVKIHSYCNNLFPTSALLNNNPSENYAFNLYGHQGGVTLKINIGASTVSECRQKLEENPIVLYFQSGEYTPEKDLPVCLETHNNWFEELDGTETGFIATSGNRTISVVTGFPLAKGEGSSGISSIAYAEWSLGGNGYYFGKNSGTIIFGAKYSAQFDSYEAFQAKMAQLYAAGTPAQFAYPLATPVVYAHDPINITATPYTASTTSNSVMMLPELLDAPVTLPEGGAADDVPTMLEQPAPMAAGKPGTFDVTSDGTSTVDVYLKAMQDGGNAATAQSVEHALSIQLNGGAATTFNGSEDKQVNITPDGIGAAPSNHTHNYAGSSSPGGAATTSLACTGNAATATKLQNAINITIGGASKTFDGTAALTYTLSDIGAIASDGSGVITASATSFGSSVNATYAKVEFKKIGVFVDVLVEVLLNSPVKNTTYEICKIPVQIGSFASAAHPATVQSGDNVSLGTEMARVSISGDTIYGVISASDGADKYIKTHFLALAI